jgi:hypothetical protein
MKQADLQEVMIDDICFILPYAQDTLMSVILAYVSLIKCTRKKILDS